jgi:hypothetical protein
MDLKETGFGGVDQINLAHVNMAMNLQVPYKEWKFLAS